MKKLLPALVAVLAAAVLAFGLAACGSSSSGKSSDSPASSQGTSTSYTAKAEGPYSSGTHHALVKVKGYDAFAIELSADDAPVTVSNFAKLAQDGYYNGLAFYRVVDGFCLQGGTKGNSASGDDASLTPIVGEFSSNGIENKLASSFKKGTVAMARTNAVNSATSTFFITLASSDAVSKSLDGKYAAFGTIDEAGMKVVDKIVADSLPAVSDQQMGTISDESKMPVIESISIVD